MDPLHTKTSGPDGGHLDQLGRFTGTLVLDGETITVDSYGARDGGDGETHVVLLYQANYLYDDLTGEGHEQTTVTCENALSRDVRDFVTYARAHGFK